MNKQLLLAWCGVLGFYLVGCNVCKGQVASDASKCVADNPGFIEWIEDYKAETDEMELGCWNDIKALQESMIGKHGPPIELELKNAACFNSCQQYIRNIDFLVELSGCSCDRLDELFPLSQLDHFFDSWCMRRPTEFLLRETGVVNDWDIFNRRYCRCNIAIACDSTMAYPSLGLMILAIWFGFR